MKKLLKSKKTLVALCLLLVAVVAAGSTFAWFTWVVETEDATVEFGRLSIAADYGGESGFLLQPGSDVSKTGSVTNTGSLQVIAKVDVEEGTVTIRSDADGNPLDGEYNIPLSDADGITATLDESKMTEVEIIGNDMYVWMRHKDTGEYYILMYGNISADLGFTVAADGTVGNLYQGAVVNYSEGWFATQIIEGAMLEYYGLVDYEAELVTLSEYNELHGLGDSLVAPANAGLAREVFNQFVERANG